MKYVYFLLLSVGVFAHDSRIEAPLDALKHEASSAMIVQKTGVDQDGALLFETIDQLRGPLRRELKLPSEYGNRVATKKGSFYLVFISDGHHHHQLGPFVDLVNIGPAIFPYEQATLPLFQAASGKKIEAKVLEAALIAALRSSAAVLQRLAAAEIGYRELMPDSLVPTEVSKLYESRDQMAKAHLLFSAARQTDFFEPDWFLEKSRVVLKGGWTWEPFLVKTALGLLAANGSANDIPSLETYLGHPNESIFNGAWGSLIMTNKARARELGQAMLDGDHLNENRRHRIHHWMNINGNHHN